MPEGDTIFRAARTLHRALAGKPVVRFESVFPALTRVHVDTPLTNQTIEMVYTSGKHLLMRFSGGMILRTHNYVLCATCDVLCAMSDVIPEAS